MRRPGTAFACLLLTGCATGAGGAWPAWQEPRLASGDDVPEIAASQPQPRPEVEPPPRHVCLRFHQCDSRCEQGDGDACAAAYLDHEDGTANDRQWLVRGCTLGSQVACSMAGLSHRPIRDERGYSFSCRGGGSVPRVLPSR